MDQAVARPAVHRFPAIRRIHGFPTGTSTFGSGASPRLNWTLDDSKGEDIEIALEELWLRDPFLRFGRSSLVAARILLQSRGVCAGCNKNIGLRGLADE